MHGAMSRMSFCQLSQAAMRSRPILQSRDAEDADTSISFIAMSGGGRAKYMEFLEVARSFGTTIIVAKPSFGRQLVNYRCL
jgi:hypothetical protein